MENEKKELIDFLKWLSKYEYSYDKHSYELVVEDYLKSINSDASGESRNVRTNEAKEEFCYNCGEKMIQGNYYPYCSQFCSLTS